MKKQTEFWKILLGSSGPTWELIGAFALGLLVVALLGNLAYDLLVLDERWWVDVIGVLAAALLLVGAAYGLFVRDQRRKQNVQVTVDESRLAPAHQGLIWLLGPGRFDHLWFAIRHHQQRGGGRHCWLVMQETTKVRQAFSQLAQALTDQSNPIQLHPVYIQSLDVKAAYTAVRAVYEREVQAVGLSPDQVIADITGGTKPLTAGMVLATITADRQIEYVQSERDAEGDPVPNTLRVVLLDADFSVTQSFAP